MKNKSLVIAKTNFRNIKLVYILSAIVMGGVLIQDIVLTILASLNIYPGSTENMSVSLGNYLFLILLLGDFYSGP